MSNQEIKSCPEFPFFGARYPDARCIDGLLWDLDSGDSEHGLTKGGEDPCPFCNTEAYVESLKDNEATNEEIAGHLKFINERYNS